MKRLSFFLIPLFLLLSGCTNSADKTNLKLKNISFTIEATYYNESYIFDGKIEKDGNLYLTVKEPEEIVGMVLIHNGDRVDINYKGLTYTPNNLPVAHTTRILYAVINEIGKDNFKLNTKDGNLRAEGKVEDKNYILTFSPAGFPLDLKISALGMSAVFSNVTSIK